jgi:hypothetical protein
MTHHMIRGTSTLSRKPATRRQTLWGLGALFAGGAFLASPRSLLAQTTDKVVRFILPVGAGSGVDTIVRAASVALGKALGHPVVIENQPGAGGIVGTSALVKSAPDGMTLSVVSNNHVIYPSVYKSLPFDPVATTSHPSPCMGSTPIVLVVNPAKTAGQQCERTGRPAQSQTRRLQLRVLRQRHHPASGRADVSGRSAGQGQAHSLQRRGPHGRPT